MVRGLPKIETSVYFDTSYPSSYIDTKKGYPLKIATFFKSKGIPILNAVETHNFIVKSLENHDSNFKVIIFSQDIVPETICEESTSNTLLREYLDAGGNIVWMGDIPLFNIGKENNAELIPAYRYGAPVYVLGIIPLFVSTLKSVDFSFLGETLGLRHHWTSTRPVLKDSTMSVLASSKNIGSDYFVDVPRERTLFGKIYNSLRNWRSVEFAGFKFEREPRDQIRESKELPRHTLYETHPSAWIKSYNAEFPLCGFFRIWDYCPRIFPDSMLEELYSFTLGVCKRIKV